MARQIKISNIIFLLFVLALTTFAQKKEEKSVPVFLNGEAQVVEGFKDSQKWIRQILWVETGFDTDGDGRPDRMHVDVTRPYQTDTEGLKLPVIYESSPYLQVHPELINGFSGIRDRK